MFTLKFSYDRPQPERDGLPDHLFEVTDFMADVERVQVDDRRFYSTWAEVRDRHGDLDAYVYLEPGPPPDGLTRKVDPKIKWPESTPVPLTLLIVWFKHKDQPLMILVHRAWLLAANGDTIERLGS